MAMATAQALVSDSAMARALATGMDPASAQA
jgi:hypothetical protein